MKTKWKIALTILIVLIGIRIYLPYAVTDYVNKVLDDVPGYTGSISDVDLHLYRGAYKIYDLKMATLKGEVPVPFIDMPQIDLSIQWSALFKGEIVGEIDLHRPQINFVMSVSDSTAVEQTGDEADWTKPIKELMPVNINRLAVDNGSIHYLDFSTSPKVDIYLDSLYINAANFTNATDKKNQLPASIDITGSSMGGGSLAIKCKLNPLMQIPDMDVEGKFEQASLPAFNEFTQAYSKLDFHKGSVSVFTEFTIKDGQLNGYVKPLVKDLKVLNLQEDKSNPLGLIWESIAGLFLEIFENQKKSQFATQVPLQGNLNNTQTSIWPVFGNIFKNAFIEAFSGSIDNSVDFNDNMEVKN